jgi:hypothetical protein
VPRPALRVQRRRSNKSTALIPSQSDFDGKQDVQNYDFMLTSRPWAFFDGRIYYK